MIKTLYICEKPSQARDIAKILGCHEKQDGCLKMRDTVVTWCFGHLLEASPPDHYCENIKPWRIDILPIIPKTWHMISKKEVSKQFKIIKACLKETETVIVATDADREGEVIARELLDICKFKGQIKRLWLSALDDASIKKALADIRDGKTTENLYHAGLGRQRADWLIGMNMTMATSVLFGRYGEGVLSVGRVQTPTLKLVVDRDHVIEHFKSKLYFELIAQFSTINASVFKAKWQPDETHVDIDGRVTNEKLINDISEKIYKQQASVKKFEDKEKKTPAPLCLSLSQLQKIASSRFGLSAKETLETAQSLYEKHKAITYPRTDCQYLPESQRTEAIVILSQLKHIHPELTELITLADTAFQSNVWNDKKITAHHAMIPTQNSDVSMVRMSATEKKLYELICRYYLAQFLGTYDYAERSVELECQGEIFKASSQTPLNQGWKRALRNLAEADDGIDQADFTIPALSVQDSLELVNATVLSKQTQPPPRFTEGTLIDAMKSIGKYVSDEKYKKILKETAGIGTEATRASIIETLFKRNYMEKNGKQIFSTEKGKKLIAVMPEMACDPILTAAWEQSLDKVAEGTTRLEDFVSEQERLLVDMLAKITSRLPSPASQPAHETSPHSCPKCKKLLVKRQSSKDKKFFFGCAGYPVCRYTTPCRDS